MCFLPFFVPIGLVGQLLYNSDKSKQVLGKTGCCELVRPEDILGCQMETRGKTISTTNTPLSKKGRKNPARVERSQLRLEKFMKKKEDKNQAESSLGNQAPGSPRAGW